MGILKTVGFWHVIWAMLRSLSRVLSVDSECLGSHPPEGGVVLGSDLLRYLLCTFCNNLTYLSFHVYVKLSHYSMFILIIGLWLVLCLLYVYVSVVVSVYNLYH